MNYLKLIPYSLLISVVFLIMHVAAASFKLKDMGMLVVTLAGMVLAQLAVFLLLKRYIEVEELTFMNIFIALGITMTFCILLLALNSAFNPYVERKPLNPAEIAISFLMFSIGFTLIITTIIWFIYVKQSAGSV